MASLITHPVVGIFASLLDGLFSLVDLLGPFIPVAPAGCVVTASLGLLEELL